MRSWSWRSAIAGVAYAASLLGAYRLVVAPVWGYLGCPLGPWDPVISALSVGAAALATLGVPRRLDGLDAWWRSSTYVVLLVPALVVPLQGRAWLLFDAVGHLGVLLIAWGLFVAVPTPRARLQHRGRGYALVLTLAALGGTALLLALLGVPRRLPGLFAVYDQRAAVRVALSAAGGPVGYVLPWLLHVVAPSLVAWGLWRRRPWLVLFGAGFVLALYAWTAQKSALLPLLVLPLVLGWGRVRAWRLEHVLVGVVVAMVAAIGVDALLGAPLASSLAIRRALVVPGVLYAQYQQFFDLHGYAFWSDNLLAFAGASPYDRPRPALVGAAWVPASRGTLWANASWWSDAWSQAGLLGLWGTALAGGLLRAAVDWTTRDVPMGLVLGALLLPVLALLNSGLLVTCVTHGLLAGWVLTFFLPRPSRGLP